MSHLISGRAVRLSPRIQRVLAPNPGVMPGTGTNTYLVGNSRLAVIDPGPLIEEHVDAVLKAAQGRTEWILITHTHPDHSPAAGRLRDETGAPVLAYGKGKKRISRDLDRPDELLPHGATIRGDGFCLRAIHTPGHASDHLCFLLEEEEVLFTGDQIMNGSTVVIAPPDGNMKAYLDSLTTLKRYRIEKLAPGHGELMDRPMAVIDGLIRHRLNRERKVIDAIKRLGPGTAESLVPAVYDDVPEFLHPIAKYSLLAHLIKLEEDGCTASSGTTWRWLG